MGDKNEAATSFELLEMSIKNYATQFMEKKNE